MFAKIMQVLGYYRKNRKRKSMVIYVKALVDMALKHVVA